MMKRILILYLLFSGLSSLVACRHEQDVIRIYPGSNDYSSVVSDILSDYPDGNVTLDFAPGEYHFFPESLDSAYICVSNNDNGWKKVVFDLSDMSNVSIIADSVSFIFHGRIVPFYLERSSDIMINGPEIDYDCPFVLEAEVLSNDKATNSIIVKVLTEHKLYEKNGTLYFCGYDWEMPISGHNIVFDKRSKSPYYDTARYFHHFWKSKLKAEKLSDRIYRISGFDVRELPLPGSVYIDKGDGLTRQTPGIIVHRSSSVRIENTSVHTSGAMALICENSRDITLHRYNVCLKEGKNRFTTSSADASHFVNCSGQINILSCLFENMLDDATNVHGAYMPVDSISDGYVFAHFGHYQQEGFDLADAGDTLRFIDRRTLEPLAEAVVESIDFPSEKRMEARIMPAGLEDNGHMAVERIGNTADVLISDCTVRNNRARSVLVSTEGNVRIENNYFESMMAGVLIAGDANKWFESGGVSYVSIKGNHFVNLGKGGENPQSALQISPEISSENRRTDFHYHGTVIFCDNTVDTFDSQVIYAMSVDSLVVKDNLFIQNDDFPQIFPGLPYIDCQFCDEVVIEGNSFSGEHPAQVSEYNCGNVHLGEGQKGFMEKTISDPNKFFYRQ